ncbi:MAG: DUF4175 family protein [Paracoccaceae bacterium]
MNRLWPNTPDKRYAGVLRTLRWRILASRLALFVEALAQSFWPVWSVGLATFAFASFGGFALFSPLIALIILTAIGAGSFGLLVLGLRKFKFPGKTATLSRLEKSTHGTPLSSLRDHPASGAQDTFTRALWDAHQVRMAQNAAQIKTAPPDLRLARHDRYGLRLMALVMALTAVFFAPGNPVSSVQKALLPTQTANTVALSFEGWLNPPAYTGLPSVYLSEVPSGSELTMPEGTQVMLRVYGEIENIHLEESVSGNIPAVFTTEITTAAATFDIRQTGAVHLFDGDTLLAEWNFTILVDAPPEVEISGEITLESGGEMAVPITASDDYGVLSGSVEITLDLPKITRRYGLEVDPVATSPITIDLPLGYGQSTQDITETLFEDLSKHVWSNLPVIVTARVLDARDQIGQSKPVQVLLPGKRFFVPLAAAIAEQRRDILWSPQNDRRVLQVLRALTYQPDDLELSAGNYLMLRATIRDFSHMLADGPSNAKRLELAETLWQLALHLEDENLSDARKRLERARDKLLSAIKNEATEAEIVELMEELRDAADNYLEMLAQEALRNEDSDQAGDLNTDPDGQQQLENLLRELQQMAENGNQEAARQLLDTILEMLENTQITEQEGQSEAEREMQQMQDALRQQQGLADETFQQLQDELNGSQRENGQTPEELANEQEALREFMESLQNQREAGPNPLGDAEENMGAARDFLNDGEAGEALNEQAQAIENLREGIRELSEEMQRSAQGQNGIEPGETQGNDPSQDPLGRPSGRTGNMHTGEHLVPGDGPAGRAQELLEEIRRRSGDLKRPQVERDYLNRLLDGF